MAIVFIILFIAIPIAELVVLIRVGETIGAWPTVAFVVLTAVVGVSLVRMQGFAILRGAQQELEANRFPVTAVFDGVCLVFAGAALIVPGFITDAVGFLLLIPGFRRLLRSIMESRLVASGRIRTWPADTPPRQQRREERPKRADGIIIEGEYEEIEPDEKTTDEPADGRQQPTRYRPDDDTDPSRRQDPPGGKR
ncbi:MAG: FxsA family protein [Rhodospirillales bacterium]|nr:MAG: FxsA family protein [Rhodospirillales bacterium]